MFPRIEYLDWIHGRPRAALHDLGSSDLRGERPFEDEATPSTIEGLPDPPAGVTLETQLATAYGVHPEQVLVTAGATHANFLAFAAAADEAREDGVEDPEFCVERPGYEPLLKTPQTVGGTVTRFRRDDDYRLDTDRLRGALTDDACMGVVTNRHNPTGRLSDRETLEAAAASARDADARLLVDEVYAPYVLREDTADTAFGGVTAADVDGAVVTSSMTKFFGLGDLRIGWLVADRELVDRARSIEHHTAAVSGTSRAMAERALAGADELAERSRDLLAENAALLSEFVERRDDVSGFVEPGSTFAFLSVDGYDGNEVAAAAEDEGLLVVPGRFFEDPERIRVSLGRETADVAASLRVFEAVLDSLASP